MFAHWRVLVFPRLCSLSSVTLMIKYQQSMKVVDVYEITNSMAEYV